MRIRELQIFLPLGAWVPRRSAVVPARWAIIVADSGALLGAAEMCRSVTVVGGRSVVVRGKLRVLTSTMDSGAGKGRFGRSGRQRDASVQGLVDQWRGHNLNAGVGWLVRLVKEHGARDGPLAATFSSHDPEFPSFAFFSSSSSDRHEQPNRSVGLPFHRPTRTRSSSTFCALWAFGEE